MIGIKGGKGEGILYLCHTNKLNIFVTIFITGRTCTKCSELTTKTMQDYSINIH